ncbi:MAG: DUF6777 domain-containing protein [Dehalococcoidia bacterium]
MLDRRVLVGVGVLVLLVIGVALYVTSGSRTASAAVVIYEPPLVPGPNPFTAPADVVFQPALTSGGAATPEPRQAGNVAPTDTPTPLSGTPLSGAGTFGGTGVNTVCDRELLIRSLSADARRKAAWAGALGIGAEAADGYIRTLRPVTLARDLRVTNHAFRDGRAEPFQAILPAGTAALVDEGGKVVARCRCGNPLLEPMRVGAATCRNCPSGYQPPLPLEPGEAPLVVVVINPPPVSAPPAPVASPSPSPSPRPTPAPTPSPTATPSPSPAPSPTPSPMPTPTPPPLVRNLAAGAAVQASSVFGGNQFPAALGVDGNVTTSWFSAGPGAGGVTTYTITLPASATVTRLEFVGNERHSTVSFRTGFGFRSWSIDLLDAEGGVLASVQSRGSGTQSQDHDLDPVDGVARVRFTGRGHEAPDCGGFAELRVLGY